MKNYNKILEAVNRGIQLALDDFDDEEQIQNVKSKQVQNRDYTKEYLDLMKEVVDLGLPSGTLWCKCNLGASQPYEYGDYYSWGEITPNKHLVQLSDGYTQNNYKFYTGPYVDVTKKQPDDYYIGKYDKGMKILQDEDDAAYQNMHNIGNYKFHIPTKEQCEELLKYTDHNEKCQKYNYKDFGVDGLLLISKLNGNEIFFPAAGYCAESIVIGRNDINCIWSSSLDSSERDAAYDMCLDRQRSYVETSARYFGLPIRPVLNKIQKL